MEENHRGKFWGGRRGLEVRSGYKALKGWGLERDWEAVGFFYTKTSFKVGNKSRVKFWKDRWCNEQPLCEIFPFLFALSDSNEA